MYWQSPTPTSFSHYRWTASMRAAAESAPITMTSLQFTHAQDLGYTDACIECHCQYRLKYMAMV